MNLLPAKKNYLGIDLGTSAIKIVELQNKGGRAILVTYGYVEQPTDIVKSSSLEMEERIAHILKSICSKSRTSTKKVIAALPSFAVFTSVINLPAMKKKDLGQAIQWEAKKFVPLPIEDMILDWKVIKPPASKDYVKDHLDKFNEARKNTDTQMESGKSKQLSGKKDEDNLDGDKAEQVDNSGDSESKPNFLSQLLKKNEGKKGEKDEENQEKNLQILLTAAPKTLVERYLRIFKNAQLEIISLETEAFALERSLVGGDSASVMIIDIGSISSDITVINNGIPILNRSIDVGGATITNALMSSLNVDIARAEQFKRDIGFSSLGEEDLPEIIKDAINPIINEVKYCIDIYLSQIDKGDIEKIILTGGSAWLPELPKYLSKLLDIEVIIGNPWDKIVYPMDLKPVLNELGPRFSVAVGLAMRGL
ncbi:MAG: pilus assembly protein PilM [Candidatus Kuenenbacteria bacterium]